MTLPHIHAEPFAVRAAKAHTEHRRKVEQEEADRAQRVTEGAVAEARLHIGKLVEDQMAVEIGDVDVSLPTAITVDATVDGVRFRWTKYSGYQRHGTEITLVQTCQVCGREDALDVRFLWQIGGLLELGPHPDGCPPPEPPPSPAATPERAITAAELRLLNSLLDILREHGIPAPE